MRNGQDTFCGLVSVEAASGEMCCSGIAMVVSGELRAGIEASALTEASGSATEIESELMLTEWASSASAAVPPFIEANGSVVGAGSADDPNASAGSGPFTVVAKGSAATGGGGGGGGGGGASTAAEAPKASSNVGIPPPPVSIPSPPIAPLPIPPKASTLPSVAGGVGNIAAGASPNPPPSNPPSGALPLATPKSVANLSAGAGSGGCGGAAGVSICTEGSAASPKPLANGSWAAEAPKASLNRPPAKSPPGERLNAELAPTPRVASVASALGGGAAAGSPDAPPLPNPPLNPAVNESTGVAATVDDAS